MPRLTDRTLSTLPEGDHYDAGLPRFGVRVTASGARSFFVRWRSPDGRNVRRTLGRWPLLPLSVARDGARRILEALERGMDPDAGGTVAELAERYLDLHARPRKRSWRADERALRVDVLPAWGAREASTLRRRDVLAMLDSIVRRGSPIQANRTLALLRKVFAWAVSRDLLETSPCVGVPRPAAEHRRERVLFDAEIAELWRGTLPALWAGLARLVLLTAQRPGEVAAWEASQIVGEWWELPGARRKSGTAQRVYLSTSARGELARLESLGLAGRFVAENPARRGVAVHETSLSHAVRLWQRGVPSADRWTPHDLRRTAATIMAREGVPRFVVRRVLGHADAEITATYDRHSYAPETRDALARLGAAVEEIVRRHDHPPADAAT